MRICTSCGTGKRKKAMRSAEMCRDCYNERAERTARRVVVDQPAPSGASSSAATADVRNDADRPTSDDADGPTTNDSPSERWVEEATWGGEDGGWDWDEAEASIRALGTDASPGRALGAAAVASGDDLGSGADEDMTESGDEDELDHGSDGSDEAEATSSSEYDDSEDSSPEYHRYIHNLKLARRAVTDVTVEMSDKVCSKKCSEDVVDYADLFVRVAWFKRRQGKRLRRWTAIGGGDFDGHQLTRRIEWGKKTFFFFGKKNSQDPVARGPLG
jgi:hypothetical protein